MTKFDRAVLGLLFTLTLLAFGGVAIFARFHTPLDAVRRDPRVLVYVLPLALLFMWLAWLAGNRQKHRPLKIP